MNTTHIAKICHEANRVYCQSIGDESQPHWEELPEEIRQSCINGVAYAIRFQPNPDQMHQNWFNQKIKDGWQYGPEKSLEQKTHPLMVPFDQLPLEHRAKDALFIDLTKVVFRFAIGIEAARAEEALVNEIKADASQ
jgi:hypothetical protein